MNPPIHRPPSRFRASAFERFAHVIGAALDDFPRAIRVDPSPLSAESYKQPLRDAIAAKQRYGYRSPSINEERFKAHADALVVVSDDQGMVYIGSRDVVRQREGRLVGQVQSSNEIVVAAVGIESVCLLLQRHALSPTPLFVVFDLDAPRIASIEARYDVVIVPHETVPNKHFLVGPLNLNIQAQKP